MNMLKPEKGTLLVSEPFLPDPHFHRSVVLLVEHNDEGTVGLVLNQETDLIISDLFDDIEASQKVYIGGPVARDKLLFLHNHPALSESEPVMPGLYWGGDFEMLKFLLNEGLMEANSVKFFAGYSGWGPGQLQEELKQKSWIVAPAKPADVFGEADELWKQVLLRLGPAFRHYGNAPDDVSLN